jgi:hypothetical protein
MGRTFSAAAVLVALAALAPSASRAAAPRTLTSYCSPSGDVCYGVRVRTGAVRLEITTAARYFPRYTLCVRPSWTSVQGAQRCGSFPMLRSARGTWSSSVRLRRQFPTSGPGVYRVMWRLGTQPLGPTLRFLFPVR